MGKVFILSQSPHPIYVSEALLSLDWSVFLNSLVHVDGSF